MLYPGRAKAGKWYLGRFRIGPDDRRSQAAHQPSTVGRGAAKAG